MGRLKRTVESIVAILFAIGGAIAFAVNATLLGCMLIIIAILFILMRGL